MSDTKRDREHRHPDDMQRWEPVRFVCVTCGARAVMNPNDHREWGCRQCGVTTCCVSLYFKPCLELVPSDN